MSLGKCLCSLKEFYINIQTTVRQAHQNTETTIPADLLLVRGTCIVNEAMLSGETTPLLKESIELWEADARLDVDGAHKTAVLFEGTKVLQSSSGEPCVYAR